MDRSRREITPCMFARNAQSRRERFARTRGSSGLARCEKKWSVCPHLFIENRRANCSEYKSWIVRRRVAPASRRCVICWTSCPRSLPSPTIPRLPPLRSSSAGTAPLHHCVIAHPESHRTTHPSTLLAIPGLSIAIASRTPSVSGHSALCSIEARSTPASGARRRIHIPAGDGRHRPTLRALCRTRSDLELPGWSAS